jgi:uncharacterized protein YcaQ
MAGSPASPASPTASLSADEARRLVLAAQGFGPPPEGADDAARVRSVLDTVHVLQIDAVNVLVRSHYVPVFSRLGPYPVEALDGLIYGTREAFETWGHAASVLPTALHPLLRWRMAAFAASDKWIKDIAKEQIDAVLAEVTDRGPLAAEDLADPGRKGAMAWSLSPGRKVLTWLQRTGRLAVAERGPNFQPRYDLADRVLPAAVLDAPAPPHDEARKELLLLAARALGVATARDLAEYFYISMGTSNMAEASLPVPLTKPPKLVKELAAEGRLVPVEVEGWSEGAYALPGATPPDRVDAAAIITPFDSVMWDRKRTTRVFGFDYSLEMYVPEAKRVYGYFVLPILLGDRLVGRVDVRREGTTLAVKGTYADAGHEPGDLAEPVAEELRKLATWRGLADIAVADRGNLAGAVAAALG